MAVASFACDGNVTLGPPVGAVPRQPRSLALGPTMVGGSTICAVLECPGDKQRQIGKSTDPAVLIGALPALPCETLIGRRSASGRWRVRAVGGRNRHGRVVRALRGIAGPKGWCGLAGWCPPTERPQRRGSQGFWARVRGRHHARYDPIALAVVLPAEPAAPALHLLVPGAWPLGVVHRGPAEVVRGVPVIDPLPDIAGHVLEAIAVGWELLHRAVAAEAVQDAVLLREGALPQVGSVDPAPG